MDVQVGVPVKTGLNVVAYEAIDVLNADIVSYVDNAVLTKAVVAKVVELSVDNIVDVYVGVPVKTGLAKVAYEAIDVLNDDMFSYVDNAVLTKAVVAVFVELSSDDGVIDKGAPKNDGLVIGA